MRRVQVFSASARTCVVRHATLTRSSCVCKHDKSSTNKSSTTTERAPIIEVSAVVARATLPPVRHVRMSVSRRGHGCTTCPTEPSSLLGAETERCRARARCGNEGRAFSICPARTHLEVSQVRSAVRQHAPCLEVAPVAQRRVLVVVAAPLLHHGGAPHWPARQVYHGETKGKRTCSLAWGCAGDLDFL